MSDNSQIKEDIPPSNTPISVPNPDTTKENVSKEKDDRTLLLIEKRENQRADLLKSVLHFSLKTIACLYFFAVAVFGLIFWKMTPENLVKLADFWHILLIVLLPPTSLLMMLIRGVSFSANSSEFKSQSNEDKEKNDKVDISTPTTVIFNEAKDFANKILDKVIPDNKEKK